MGGINPQELLNREALHHANPDSDNSHEKVVAIGIELPDVDNYDPVVEWANWQADQSFNVNDDKDASIYFASDESASIDKNVRKVRKYKIRDDSTLTLDDSSNSRIPRETAADPISDPTVAEQAGFQT